MVKSVKVRNQIVCACVQIFFSPLAIEGFLLTRMYHAVLNDGEGYELDWTDGDTRYRYVVRLCHCML